jgi:heat shock protein HslJ
VPKLTGTTWRLVDLSGAPALSEPAATISFPEEGRVAGSGSCNRFFGGVSISGESLTLSGIGSTKMACPEPIMSQEKSFLEALGNATRYAIDGSTLSIWVKGSDKPLRLTREAP